MLTTFKLPFSFDPAPLREDLSRLAPTDWVAHFNKSYYEGDWSGASLRAVGGDATKIYPDPTASALFADTPLLDRCPNVRKLIETFECPLLSVRFLRLGAGSSIREHRDYNLGYEDGEVRIHVPVATNARVEFYLDGQRLTLREGEAWYINFNLPHRVQNLGDTPRVHLVLDCVVNEWLDSILPRELLRED
jgi:hypothetical protein